MLNINLSDLQRSIISQNSFLKVMDEKKFTPKCGYWVFVVENKEEYLEMWKEEEDEELRELFEEEKVEGEKYDDWVEWYLSNRYDQGEIPQQEVLFVSDKEISKEEVGEILKGYDFDIDSVVSVVNEINDESEGTFGDEVIIYQNKQLSSHKIENEYLEVFLRS